MRARVRVREEAKMEKIPIYSLPQITDERWGEITAPPWYTEEEILENQITIEEALSHANP